MTGIIIAIILIIVIIIAYFVIKNKLSTNGTCVYLTYSDKKYTCNCNNMSENNCNNNKGTYSNDKKCDATISNSICQKSLGSCLTSTTCTYPTTKENCTNGTWTEGNSCR
jgi:uncharacterized protein (UPF0333 family)